MSDDSNINDINGHNDPELSRLYQSGERPQPPANLDAAIKSAARTNPAPRRSHVVPWLGALAASLFAAVLVVQLYPVAVHEPELSSERLDAPMKERAIQSLEERNSQPMASPALQDSIRQLAPQPASPLRSHRARSAESDTEASAGMAPPAAKQAPATVSPESELQAIVQLLDAGDHARARQRLAEFRERYPGFEVPRGIARRAAEPESAR